MVPRKLQVSELLKSWSSICDESRSLVFVGFLESRIFELFAVKFQIVKQGLCISAALGFYQSPLLRERRGVSKAKIIIKGKYCMKQNWNFRWVGFKPKNSLGGVWMFSGTIHCQS